MRMHKGIHISEAVCIFLALGNKAFGRWHMNIVHEIDWYFGIIHEFDLFILSREG